MFTRESLHQLKSIVDIEAITPRDFEWFAKFLMEYLEYKKVFVTEKHGEREADGGVDLIMLKEEEKIYVQCKKWNFGFNGNILPVRIIRELGGCMLRDKVHRGLVITTLEIDDLDRREAEKMNIELIGRADLIQYMISINPEFNTKKIGILHWCGKLVVGIIASVITFLILVFSLVVVVVFIYEIVRIFI